jgi:hypothetical protein
MQNNTDESERFIGIIRKMSLTTEVNSRKIAKDQQQENNQTG